jgi:CRP-like cAMP-binding protein
MADPLDFHFRSDQNPLFRRLSVSTLLSGEESQAISALPVNVRTYKPGQDLAREGDRPTQSCLILEGFACRSKALDDGRRQIFSFHISGDIPDLQSLYMDYMDHDLVTLTSIRVAFIPHASLRELMLNHPRVIGALWRETLIDAAIFREWMVGMGQRSGIARIAHLLCEMMVRLKAIGLMDGMSVRLPITQEQIGDAIGLSPVHVSRVFKEIRLKGLIRTEGRTLIVTDWAGLIEIGEFDPAYLHLRSVPRGHRTRR